MLVLEETRDFNIYKLIEFVDVKKEVDILINSINEESPIKDAKNLEDRFNKLNNDNEKSIIQQIKVNEEDSNEEEFYFTIEICLKKGYKFINSSSNNTYQITITKYKT